MAGWQDKRNGQQEARSAQVNEQTCFITEFSSAFRSDEGSDITLMMPTIVPRHCTGSQYYHATAAGRNPGSMKYSTNSLALYKVCRCVYRPAPSPTAPPPTCLEGSKNIQFFQTQTKAAVFLQTKEKQQCDSRAALGITMHRCPQLGLNTPTWRKRVNRKVACEQRKTMKFTSLVSNLKLFVFQMKKHCRK